LQGNRIKALSIIGGNLPIYVRTTTCCRSSLWIGGKIRESAHAHRTKKRLFMNAEIVSIGTELLLGEINDTNATYLAQQLKNIGLNLFYRTTVGDNERRIGEVLRLALSRADIIITTGGLGPTIDDMTRQSVAAAVDQPLVFRPALMEQIAARFARFNVRMTDNNRTQAMLPEQAIAIENPVGTAPGFIVETEHGAIISLPGVPHEMKHLMEHSVIPYLQQRIGFQGMIKLRVLRTAGAGESWLGEQIADVMQLSNPTVGTAAHGGQTDIRITAKADDDAAADALIAPVEAQIRERVGEYIFGVDKESLDGALIAALKESGQKLDIFEAGTERALYTRLTAQPGGADVIGHAPAFSDNVTLCANLGLDVASLEPKALIDAIRKHYPSTHQSIVAAVVVQPNETLLAVADADALRQRSYAHGATSGTGEAAWMVGWAIGISWVLLTKKPDPMAASALSNTIKGS
jgi:nicotinamide-nucleotide amidase